MKKILACILILALLALSLCSCDGFNYDVVDTQFKFDKAIVVLPNGERMEIALKSWRDYENGEQLQLTSTDGTVYLVSSYNCILIDD